MQLRSKSEANFRAFTREGRKYFLPSLLFTPTNYGRSGQNVWVTVWNSVYSTSQSLQYFCFGAAARVGRFNTFLRVSQEAIILTPQNWHTTYTKFLSECHWRFQCGFTFYVCGFVSKVRHLRGQISLSSIASKVGEEGECLLQNKV